MSLKRREFFHLTAGGMLVSAWCQAVWILDLPGQSPQSPGRRVGSRPDAMGQTLADLVSFVKSLR